MNRTEGTYMEETEEGRQSSDYTGNKDNDLKKMTFVLTVKAGICNSKAEKKGKETNLRKQKATYSINRRVETEFLKMLWWKVSRNRGNLKRWNGVA